MMDHINELNTESKIFISLKNFNKRLFYSSISVYK